LQGRLNGFSTSLDPSPDQKPSDRSRRCATVPAGAHQAWMEFAYAVGGLGKSGTVSLYTGGTKVGFVRGDLLRLGANRCGGLAPGGIDEGRLRVNRSHI